MSALILPIAAAGLLAVVIWSLAWLWDRRQARKRREALEDWMRWSR